MACDSAQRAGAGQREQLGTQLGIPPLWGEVALRGAAAGRVVRLLADVTPPYAATEVASQAGVNLSCTSRLLIMLDREVLVRRAPRGRVEHVEWAALLRRRAESYQVFTTNTARGFIATRCPRHTAAPCGADERPLPRTHRVLRERDRPGPRRSTEPAGHLRRPRLRHGVRAGSPPHR